MIKLLNQPITVRHTITKEILKALNFKAVCTSSVDYIEHRTHGFTCTYISLDLSSLHC